MNIMQIILTPDLILEAYRHGLFPMAYAGDSPYIHWVCPEERGILPIAGFHVSKSLRRSIKAYDYDIRFDTAFEDVIRACGAETTRRPETWINDNIINVYCDLHAHGHAHSAECWRDGVLIGGVYGLKIGSAFFGESMFSRASNGSKIALTHLVARLWRGGFTLFDTQFVNDHLIQFGIEEVSHLEYMARLQKAADRKADFIIADISQPDIMNAFLQKRAS